MACRSYIIQNSHHNMQMILFKYIICDEASPKHICICIRCTCSLVLYIGIFTATRPARRKWGFVKFNVLYCIRTVYYIHVHIAVIVNIKEFYPTSRRACALEPLPSSNCVSVRMRTYTGCGCLCQFFFIVVVAKWLLFST